MPMMSFGSNYTGSQQGGALCSRGQLSLAFLRWSPGAHNSIPSPVCCLKLSLLRPKANKTTTTAPTKRQKLRPTKIPLSLVSFQLPPLPPLLVSPSTHLSIRPLAYGAQLSFYLLSCVPNTSIFFACVPFPFFLLFPVCSVSSITNTSVNVELLPPFPSICFFSVFRLQKVPFCWPPPLPTKSQAYLSVCSPLFRWKHGSSIPIVVNHPTKIRVFPLISFLSSFRLGKIKSFGFLPSLRPLFTHKTQTCCALSLLRPLQTHKNKNPVFRVLDAFRAEKVRGAAPGGGWHRLQLPAAEDPIFLLLLIETQAVEDPQPPLSFDHHFTLGNQPHCHHHRHSRQLLLFSFPIRRLHLLAVFSVLPAGESEVGGR